MTKLRKLIESVFEEDYGHVAGARSFRDLESWDSLNYVKLVVAIQKEFAIELTPSEIRMITSVAAIGDVLKAKGVDL